MGSAVYAKAAAERKEDIKPRWCLKAMVISQSGCPSLPPLMGPFPGQGISESPISGQEAGAEDDKVFRGASKRRCARSVSSLCGVDYQTTTVSGRPATRR